MSLRCYERVKSLYDTIEQQKDCKRSDDVTALHKEVADVYSEVEELTKFTQHLRIQVSCTAKNSGASSDHQRSVKPSASVNKRTRENGGTKTESGRRISFDTYER